MTRGVLLKLDMVPEWPRPLIAFFHAQRTGGSELKRFFRDGFGDDRVYAQQTVQNYKKWPSLSRLDLEDFDVYAGHSNYDGRKIDERMLLPVTVVRDPVIRCFSLHRYCANKAHHPLRELANKRNVVDFYVEGSKAKPEYFNNVQCRRVCGKPDASCAIDTVECDYFGVAVTDAISEFAAGIGRTFGLAARLPEARESDALRHQGLIPEQLVEAVRGANMEDLTLFNHVLESAKGENEFAVSSKWSR